MSKQVNLKEIILDAYIEVLREQEDVLTTSSDEILGKFPTLRKQLIKLFTKDFNTFVKDVKWVAPRPTTFEVVLNNDTAFTLKWNGKGFIGTIEGKRYSLFLGSEFQQALDRINRMLQQAAAEPDKEGDDMFGGEEPVGGDEFIGGTDVGAPEPPEDLGFEEPVEEPEV